MLLAFDDTDGPDGGCTTRALLDVLAALEGLAPGGLPRLVRLNPNVPWKTRGNGAVCVPLVYPDGPHSVIGEWRGSEVHAFPHGTPAVPDAPALDAVWGVLRRIAQPDAHPAVAWFAEPPPPALYADAVRTFVEPAVARSWMETQPRTLWRATGDGRALAGCMGAAAWPGPATSHEFIAYREPERWGTARAVEPLPLSGLDASGATFHTLDGTHPVCVPRTPCPVLLGLRGRDPQRLLQAARPAVLAAAREPIDAWLLWDSNQASGDHVTPISTLIDAPYLGTVAVEATVAGPPEELSGGHVRVPMDDPFGLAFDAMAFEPTKGFRAHARGLRPGDGVGVVGAWRDGTLHLEQLHLRAPLPRKVANPIHCGKAMKSRGANAGYRCACGATAPPDAASFEARSPGEWEVPISARRHLHRPLEW